MRPLFLIPVLSAATAVFAQTPAFDVASIRVSQIGKGGGEGSRRERIQVTPDAVNMANLTLRGYVRWAYHVLDVQVVGPDWIGSERYDITAKAGRPVDEDQLRLMMQTLLAERFKMTSHRQTKEMQAYLLTVLKSGPKFTESKTDGEPDMKPDQAKMSVAVQRTPISQLVGMLSTMFQAPVVDQTELKGKYDITINVAKYLADFGPRGTGPGGGEAPPDPHAIIIRGLQEELGLKLEAKKLPVDLVVIDRAEKVPVEN